MKACSLEIAKLKLLYDLFQLCLGYGVIIFLQSFLNPGVVGKRYGICKQDINLAPYLRIHLGLKSVGYCTAALRNHLGTEVEKIPPHDKPENQHADSNNRQQFS